MMDDNKIIQKQQKTISRLEDIIYSMADYIGELWSYTEFSVKQHAQELFKMSDEEVDKFFCEE